ncbi:hypothetical protein [Bradyrhizobium tunisiense]|uniref:hypothetical protein n=1 Tax=Bradyrhizobium tunisiense TaxID=3278709 RepID=UPI0035DD0849
MTAGIEHQALLLWATRRMSADGFGVVAFDGIAGQAGRWNDLPTPFPLHGRRPDAVGLDAGGSLAFCEAKIGNDILCRRTREQFEIFGRLKMRGSSVICPLYVAVPREQAPLLDQALVRAGIAGARNIVRMHIPEILIGSRSNAA